MDIKRVIETYHPTCEQEEKDRETMLSYLSHFDNLLTRDNEYAHFTGSSLLVNKKRDRALMVFHNLYNSWSWTGGHADGEEDLLAVAVKEAMEETGVLHVRPISPEVAALDILPVWGHFKRGKYVSSHQHLSLAYLLEADEEETLAVKPDENSGVRWFPLDKICEVCSEPEMRKVYQKLIDRLRDAGH
jgi:8-oxo-dGTP pyrophosphatase MutT (NUDIX family)